MIQIVIQLAGLILITTLGHKIVSLIMPVAYYVPMSVFYLLNLLKLAGAISLASLFRGKPVIVSACLALASESLFLFVASWSLSPHMGPIQAIIVLAFALFVSLIASYLTGAEYPRSRPATAVSGGIFAVITSAWFSAWQMDWQYWPIRLVAILLPPFLVAIIQTRWLSKRLRIIYVMLEPVFVITIACVLEKAIRPSIVFDVSLLVHTIGIAIPSAFAAGFCFIILGRRRTSRSTGPQPRLA